MPPTRRSSAPTRGVQGIRTRSGNVLRALSNDIESGQTASVSGNTRSSGKKRLPSNSQITKRAKRARNAAKESEASESESEVEISESEASEFEISESEAESEEPESEAESEAAESEASDCEASEEEVSENEALDGCPSATSSSEKGSQKDRYYCPYSKCANNFSFRASLFQHIRLKHDGDYPCFTEKCDRFIFKTPEGKTFCFTDESCQGTIQRGESIIVERLDGLERFYCPYQQCDRDFSTSPFLYKHFRKCHHAVFDSFVSKRHKEFKAPNGAVLNFKSEDCRNTLKPDDPLVINYIKGEVRFYCPYQECIRSFHVRGPLYSHIREMHCATYPLLKSGERVSKTASGTILHFDNESCRNTLKPEDIIVAYLTEQFYCPYKKCKYGSERYVLFRDHIRNKHDSEFPSAPYSSKRRYKTEDGEALDFNSESCRDTLKTGDTIVIEYLDSTDLLYCPYKGCTMSYTASPNFRRHIRKEHFTDFPNTLVYTSAIRTPRGALIDFKSKACRNMLKPDEPMIFEDENFERSYCPYKKCSQYFKSRISFTKHIRTFHFAKCPGLFSTTRIYKTPKGDVLDFTESCRDKLKNGDAIISVDPKDAVIKKYYFCPYQGCALKLTERNKVYAHIRATHQPDCPKITMTYPLYKTESGDIIDFEESCRNTLKPGDKILLETANSKGASYCCPYKGCSKRNITGVGLYDHIRRLHYQDLPKKGNENRMRSVYATVSGKVMNFDENCRDQLEDGDKLILLRAPAIKKGTGYCPYKGCDFSTLYRHLFGHIRHRHDPEFRKTGVTPRVMSIYTGPMGNLITFDEGSRNTVDNGEKITVTDFREGGLREEQT